MKLDSMVLETFKERDICFDLESWSSFSFHFLAKSMDVFHVTNFIITKFHDYMFRHL